MKRIHVIIKGRSGNQLFQYAFARMLQEKTGGELILDYSELGFNKSAGKYGPEKQMDNVLDYFTVKPYTYVDAGTVYKRSLPHKAQLLVYKALRKLYRFMPDQTEKISNLTSGLLQRFGIYYQYGTNSLLHFRQPNSFTKNILIRGWFESESYFESIRDILRSELQLSTSLSAHLEQIKEQLSIQESICISIRRGDFTSDAYKDEFLICTTDYYLKGLKIILDKYPNAIVFVCSDDIDWCKNNVIPHTSTVIYEPHGLSISEKLHLMTSCHHFVLSNSTFSFWVQYLSGYPGKMVVAPSKWRNSNPPVKDIYMKNWILVDC